MAGMETVIAMAVGAVGAFALTVLVVRARRKALERRRELRERLEAGRAEFERQLLEALTGATAMEVVPPAEIRRGDKVCWTSQDRSAHEHYEAGFNGDAGPSETGVHARPVRQRSND